MKRILLVKTSSLGDVVHNLPVVNDILTKHPNAQIDWLVEDSFASIPRLHPKVHQVLTVGIRRWRKQLTQRKTWQEVAAFKKAVGATQYDLVIDTQGLVKSAWMTRYAQGEVFGYDKKTARERLASCFYDQTFSISRELHAVTRNRQLTAFALGMPEPSSPPDYGISATSTLDIALPEDFIIGLHGTSKASKLWPTTHWIDLAEALATQNLSLVLPWASEAEQIRANEIAETRSNVLVLPKCSINTLAAIIQKARVSVGVDTGLSHLSAALSKATVAIYTDTKPSRTGVMAGIADNAINLGGVGQIPSVETVLSHLNQYL